MFPIEIQSVKEAYALLSEWPPSKRNTAHAIALNACRAALSGEVDAETARSTFVAFARRTDLLAPEEAALPSGKWVRSEPLQGAIAANRYDRSAVTEKVMSNIRFRKPVRLCLNSARASAVASS